MFESVPHDAGAWLCEDQYMFGSQILVAPLMESGNERTVYLPEGKWIDYQSGAVYDSGYRNLTAGRIPCVILVRDGSLIPKVPVAQSTDKIEASFDGNVTEWKAEAAKCSGLLYRPGDAKLQTVEQ